MRRRIKRANRFIYTLVSQTGPDDPAHPISLGLPYRDTYDDPSLAWTRLSMMELWFNSAHKTHITTTPDDQLLTELSVASHPCFSTNETSCSSIPLHSCETCHGPFACVSCDNGQRIAIWMNMGGLRSTHKKKLNSPCIHYATGYVTPTT